MGERFIRTSEVQRKTGLGRTTIWRLERSGRFPARRSIVGQAVGWIESEVDRWIESRPAVGTNEPDATTGGSTDAR